MMIIPGEGRRRSKDERSQERAQAMTGLASRGRTKPRKRSMWLQARQPPERKGDSEQTAEEGVGGRHRESSPGAERNPDRGSQKDCGDGDPECLGLRAEDCGESAGDAHTELGAEQ